MVPGCRVDWLIAGGMGGEKKKKKEGIACKFEKALEDLGRGGRKIDTHCKASKGNLPCDQFFFFFNGRWWSCKSLSEEEGKLDSQPSQPQQETRVSYGKEPNSSETVNFSWKEGKRDVWRKGGLKDGELEKTTNKKLWVTSWKGSPEFAGFAVERKRSSGSSGYWGSIYTRGLAVAVPSSHPANMVWKQFLE